MRTVAKKARAKAKTAPKVDQAQSKEHRNFLARFRHAIKAGGADLKRRFDDASKLEKKRWRKVFGADGNFDRVESSKTIEKSRESNETKGADWLTADGILAAEGWSEENRNTEFGQRAERRAQLLIRQCTKMGKKW